MKPLCPWCWTPVEPDEPKVVSPTGATFHAECVGQAPCEICGDLMKIEEGRDAHWECERKVLG